MSVNYIEIDTGQLNRDIQEMDEMINAADKSFADMIQEIEELNMMWKGTANMTFQMQFEQDTVLMKELLAEMGKLSEYMKYASSEYVKCEKEVKSMVDNIRI